MTLAARHRHMPACEFELQLLVLCQREQRWLVALYRMARFAFCKVRRMRELSLVKILVAVHAFRELYLVDRRRALRNMALGALHGRVLPHQRIRSLVVIRKRKLRLLEAVHGVARFTLPAIRALRKLPVMRILVAIVAEPE